LRDAPATSEICTLSTLNRTSDRQRQIALLRPRNEASQPSSLLNAHSDRADGDVDEAAAPASLVTRPVMVTGS
jgi:hypothetical protein